MPRFCPRPLQTGKPSPGNDKDRARSSRSDHVRATEDHDTPHQRRRDRSAAFGVARSSLYASYAVTQVRRGARAAGSAPRGRLEGCRERPALVPLVLRDRGRSADLSLHNPPKVAGSDRRADESPSPTELWLGSRPSLGPRHTGQPGRDRDDDPQDSSPTAPRPDEQHRRRHAPPPPPDPTTRATTKGSS